MIKDFIINLDLTSMVIGALVSALVASWLDFVIKQPKLEYSGCGSGKNASDNTLRNNLSFRNKVGWFGLHMPETRVIGFRIHPNFRKGLTFEKNPARDCRANLFLKETMEHIGQLWWKNDKNTLSEVTTIESGKQSSLILFCRKQDSEYYFVYRPTSKDNDFALVPDINNQFIGETEFILKINYSHSHTHEEVIKISKKFNGLLYLETKNGSSIF